MAFEDASELALDVRAAGIAAGVVAVWRKAQPIRVGALATAVTAGVRALS